MHGLRANAIETFSTGILGDFINSLSWTTYFCGVEARIGLALTGKSMAFPSPVAVKYYQQSVGRPENHSKSSFL